MDQAPLSWDDEHEEEEEDSTCSTLSPLSEDTPLPLGEVSSRDSLGTWRIPHTTDCTSTSTLPRRLISRRRLERKFALSDPQGAIRNLAVTYIQMNELPVVVHHCDALKTLEEQIFAIYDDDNTTLPDRVVVAVEATTVCRMDLKLSKDTEYPFVSGRSFCGVVHDCSQEKEIKTGCRVAGIIGSGADARYVYPPKENLFLVPKNLDSADVGCLIALYLPAFQALHHGQYRNRYDKNWLGGKSVLVTGGASPEGEAVVRLALLAGAKDVYVTGTREQFDLIKSQHGIPVNSHPDDWLEKLENRVNLIIDLDFPRNLDCVGRSLSRKGRLVCCPGLEHNRRKSTWLGSLGSVWDYYSLMTVHRSSLFDFLGSFKYNRREAKRDFEFLLDLLSKRMIRPRIDRYIGLRDVPSVHEELRNMALAGAIVCEPWKE